jgi:transposase
MSMNSDYFDFGQSYYSTDKTYCKVDEHIEKEAIRKVVGVAHSHVYVQELTYIRTGLHGVCPWCGCRDMRYLRCAQKRWVVNAYVCVTPHVVGFRTGRLQCRDCGRNVSDYPRGIHAYLRHSAQMLYFIFTALRHDSIEGVCRRYHIDHKTVTKYLLRHVNIAPNWDALSHEKEVRFEIDEHSFGGRDLVITVVESVTKQVIAILNGCTKKDLQEYLQTIPLHVKKKVRVCATDLTPAYCRVLKEWKSDVIVCADPFHVVRVSTQLMEKERLFMQSEKKGTKIPSGPLRAGGERLSPTARQKRQQILTQYPTIEIAYRIKETIRAMYLCGDSTRATLLYDAAVKEITDACADATYFGIRKELQTFLRTLQRWREHILHYFIYHLSTARVEGFHTRIKLIKRISYGFVRKDTYRSKITLGLCKEGYKYMQITFTPPDYTRKNRNVQKAA